MQMPRYCYSCGVYLMGGATEHKPDCEVLRLIQEAFVETEEPKKEPGAKA